ncbi:Phosphoglycerate mutase family [Streptococcus sp. DD10]|uniref:histidine phosphatase family protein n=1 Tax=Streptococcus sp. DD10 TaxID=1777878 RepID=UPI0007924529|nr:histidine phosphatase family protein [Streptococcus sp. DD10]KXT74691.1 Phosphoglycerate mutase family [Streptococcus sp. DD10]
MTQFLYLMRHGQTLFNQRHLIQGWCDSPLTKLGIYQAQVARDYFKQAGITFDAAFSSTQERATDTLEIVTEGALPYQRIKGLKEWNFGVFEGESEDLNPSIPYRDFFVPYGGESQTQVQERMDTTIRQLMDGSAGKHILMVSHGGALFNFARVHEHNWECQPQGHIGNCCIYVFRYQNQEFYLETVIDHDFSA